MPRLCQWRAFCCCCWCLVKWARRDRAGYRAAKAPAGRRVPSHSASRNAGEPGFRRRDTGTVQIKGHNQARAAPCHLCISPNLVAAVSNTRFHVLTSSAIAGWWGAHKSVPPCRCAGVSGCVHEADSSPSTAAESSIHTESGSTSSISYARQRGRPGSVAGVQRAAARHPRARGGCGAQEKGPSGAGHFLSSPPLCPVPYDRWLTHQPVRAQRLHRQGCAVPAECSRPQCSGGDASLAHPQSLPRRLCCVGG